MAQIKLRYVQPFIDRHGKPRHYFRRPGFKRVPLPGLPGSSEFNAAYEAAMSGGTAPAIVIGASRSKAGTINALAAAWYASPAFTGLDELTRSTYRNIIERFCRDHDPKDPRKIPHGDKRVAMLDKQTVKRMLAEKAKTPAAANHWLLRLRVLMQFAIEEGYRADDPTVGVNFLDHTAKHFHTWTEDEIGQFEAKHEVGTKARLAMALMLYVSGRRSDAVKLGPQHVKNGFLTYTQQKNRKRNPVTLTVPVHPELSRIIAATPSGHLTFLTTAYGKPRTAKGFGNWFREQCDVAGLPHCSAHGLRRACARRLAEAGCSEKLIASITGHRDLRQVTDYTKDADQKRMASKAMTAMIEGANDAEAEKRTASVKPA
jgi:integrase